MHVKCGHLSATSGQARDGKFAGQRPPFTVLPLCHATNRNVFQTSDSLTVNDEDSLMISESEKSVIQEVRLRGLDRRTRDGSHYKRTIRSIAFLIQCMYTYDELEATVLSTRLTMSSENILVPS